MDSSPPKDVAIIGAGLTGLSLALALHRVSIPCVVYESRSESFSCVGSINLCPNALGILDSLGVYERVRDKGFHFDTLEFKNEDGETTSVYCYGSKKLYGYHAFRITRQLLVNELKTILQESSVEVKYNAKLSHVIEESPEGVVFGFADGSESSAALLIGSDGVHSPVRGYIHPNATPKYSGQMGFMSSVVPRSKIRVPDDYHLPAAIKAKLGVFLLMPQLVDGSEILIHFQSGFKERDGDGGEQLSANQGLLDRISKNKKYWPDIVQSALEGAPMQNMGIQSTCVVPRLETWASEMKRVIIVGEAAHTSQLGLGQLVDQPVEDIDVLALLLSKLSPNAPLAKALDFWQTHRQERLDKVVELTKQMKMRHWPAEEQAKLPPGVDWMDEGENRVKGRQLRGLYQPELRKQVELWVMKQQG